MVISKITPFLGFLSELEVLPPVEAKGLQVFGLRGPPRRTRISYRTLSEALAAGAVAVSEAGPARGVQAVRVMNQGGSSVLLAAGERLVGPRHVWVLKKSLLVGGQETLHVPARSEERRVGKECRSRW